MHASSLTPDSYERLRDSLFREGTAEAVRRFGEIAVARGYVTPLQVEECLQEQERGGAGRPGLGQMLLRKGYLSVGRFLEILRVQGTGEEICPRCGAEDVPQGEEICGACAGKRDDVSGRRIGKYRLVREVGRGGMAVVYEAEDPDLRRRVALKVVREDRADTRFIRRHHREASIAAQLQHPNIVAIHEVGMARDSSGAAVHFIAMDFVEGRTLSELLRERKTPRSELLRIVEEIAWAAAHAHGKEVVHRDLKPANVLVEKSGRVLLTDFGLARADDLATRMTVSGALLGTPQYMAPEQVEGRQGQVGTRTDVYGLGTILYEILTGRPPFIGENQASLFRRILEEDPPRPGSVARGVEAELDWICMKSLAKDPQARYADARGFADDLRRFRLGEPVEARRPGIGHRARRLTRRHRAATLMAAMAGAALAALLIYFVPRVLSAEQRILELLQKNMPLLCDRVLAARRVGEMGKFQEFLKQAREQCLAVEKDFPEAPEPNHYLGRLHRAMMEEAEALKQQDAALQKDPRYLAALYERLVLHAAALQEEKWMRVGEVLGARYAMNGSGNDKLPPPPKNSVSSRAQQLEQAMLHDFEAMERDSFRGVESWQRDCARALLSWARGEGESGREMLGEVLRGQPLLEEARLTLADLELEQGRLAVALKLYEEGAEKDAGFWPYRHRIGQVRIIRLATGASRDPSEDYRKAEEEFNRILGWDPGREFTRLLRGELYLHLAQREFAIGQNGEKWVGKATDDFDEALRRNPGSTFARTGLARVLHWVANQESDPGKQEEGMRKALEHLDRAVESGRDWQLLMLRGEGRADLARAVAFAGGEGDPIFAQAIRDLEEASEAAPEMAIVWLKFGVVFSKWGLVRRRAGADPSEMFEEAVRRIEKALEGSPADAQAWVELGGVEVNWGIWVENQGGDGTARFQAGVEHLNRAVHCAPEDARARQYRGNAYASIVLRRGRAGLDAVEEARSGLEDFREAVRFNLRLETEVRPAMEFLERYLGERERE